MKRRYDLRRSDNIPLTAQITLPYQEKTVMFVYTGFPVAWVSVLSVHPLEIKVFPSWGKEDKDGFYMKCSNVPPETDFITVSYQAG